MCFQLSKDLYDEDTEKMLMIDEHGRELVSFSPWRFLDKCRTPAERQAAIYRHQHKSRASHFEVQDRAELHAAFGRAMVDEREFWMAKAIAAEKPESGLLRFAECFAASALFVTLAGGLLLWIAG
jgi:hypothetical protein